ncbi:unnamed protein product [Rangifer tarandus platyrhynchus]|uniref:Uncharacterized protein n=1 Tax=Rangifer tarandus platyrhynchus TaxID=3082113 RepID=A0ABN9A8J6_RANTA|nr:unnamed protein product [Rangifer tarandus platyrhynchus]
MQAYLLSCAMQKEGHYKQTPLACVGSTHSGWTTLGCHSPRWGEPSMLKSLKLPGTPRGPSPRWAVRLMYFPGSSYSNSLLKGTVPGELCILCTSHVQATQAPRCATSTQSVPCGPCISSGELPQAVTLLADMNHSGSQEDMVSNWHPAHSLPRDVVSGLILQQPLTFPLF